MKPQPRPALKRAEDADLHPALTIAPTQVPAGRRDTPAAAAGKAAKPGKPGKGKQKSGAGPYRSAGQATSDVLRGPSGKQDKGAKPVKLTVRVPKRVRKELQAIAKHSGSSVDAIVAQALAEWLGDPRRW